MISITDEDKTDVTRYRQEAQLLLW